MSVGRDGEFMLSVFLMEAWDAIAMLEDGLSAGAPAPDSLLVVAHRLKGTAALNGYPGIARLAGSIETAIEWLPDEDAAAREATVTTLVHTTDALKSLLDGVATTGHEDSAAAAAVFTAPQPSRVSPSLGLSADVLEYFGPEAIEHLETMTASLLALERDGANPDEIANLFRAAHTLKGAAYTVGAPLVGDLAHAMEDHLVPVREARAPLTTALVEALLAGIDAVSALLGLGAAPAGEAHALLGVARTRLAALTPPAEPVVASMDTASVEPELHPVVTPALPIPEVSPPPSRERSSIRVTVDRLDGLMHLVGELVTSRRRLERRLDELERVGELMLASRARMTHAVQRFEAKHAYGPLPTAPTRDGLVPGFHDLEFDRYDDFNILARSVAEIAGDLGEVQGQLATVVRTVGHETAQVQRLTDALRGEVAQARMVPIGGLFARFARHVRDVARAEGKTVTVEVSGGDVAVDNRILEAIADPLLHLVRNAVAHGLETEAERVAAGKAPAGTLWLSAVQRGASVHVEVADNGRGIDVKALPARAVKCGLLRADEAARLTERAALDLIFLPGFSTAASPTSVAGRGVGMDVVRTNVSRLNGEVSIDTTVGVGTRFELRLPLTVAITDALMVRAGAETFAIPLSSVKVVLEVPSLDGDALVVDGEPLPLIALAATLGLPAADPGRRVPVVVVRTARTTFALVVDALAGKDEIVIQTLDAFLDGEGPFSGATISPDGRVIMILDPARVLDASRGVGRPAPLAAPDVPLTPAGHRVLLVDDSVTVRKFVGQMLERAGFQVIVARDGEEALEALADNAVDIVVTDLEMPRLDGYGLIRDLRRSGATRDLPIVIVTTRAGAKHADLARELGVQHYVTKPVDAERLVPLIEGLVNGEAAAR